MQMVIHKHGVKITHKGVCMSGYKPICLLFLRKQLALDLPNGVRLTKINMSNT